MNNLPWLKLYVQDWMTDSNVGELGSEDRICYLTMMCMAHLSKKRGTILSFSEDKVIRESKFKTREEADRAVGFSERMGKMLRKHGTSVTIPNFLKRQDGNLSGYERVKRHREKVKRVDNADDNAKITLDKEKDTDKERDINTFEHFWNLYPRKVAKRKAEQSWKKIPVSEYEAIYADVQKRCASEGWQKNGGQFIPHPTTYLNQERWKEQISVHSPPIPQKRCIECKKTSSSGWVQVPGGVACMDCFGKTKPDQRLQNSKADVFKSLPKINKS
jgi:hypothetical protein